MQQAEDFRQESRALAAVIEPLAAADFMRPTQFKQWTIDDVLGHLHMFNVAAERTLAGASEFEVFFAPILQALNGGQTLLQTQGPWLDGRAGPALFGAWRQGAERLADAYAKADPKHRVKWAGPDMSALSSITARQMETWAHGQAVFDLLGQQRQEQDRVRNIVHLGVGTFGWTFVNRKEPVPEPAPYVRLTGPSGAVWAWNAEQADNAVEGSAVEFAQVVTQTRNVADTGLRTRGESARRWMAMAQCFAGQPEDPPARGLRHRALT
jgi:uncharacterized protein (TIGR03084 family)